MLPEEIYKIFFFFQDTGIGKVVNSFRKREGEIGEKARAVVTQWKAIVSLQDDPPVEKTEPDSTTTSHHDSKPSKSKNLSESDKREKSLANHTAVNSPHSKNISKSTSDREHHDKISRTEKESSSVSSMSKTESSHHKAHSSSKGRHSNLSEDTPTKHNNKSSREKSQSEGKQKDKKSSHTSKGEKKSSKVGADGLSFEDFMNYDDLDVRKKFKKSKNSVTSKKEKTSKEVPKVKTETAGSSRSVSMVPGSKRSTVVASSDSKILNVPSPSKKVSGHLLWRLASKYINFLTSATPSPHTRGSEIRNNLKTIL